MIATNKPIYINGVKATKKDLTTLFDRIRKGKDSIVGMYITKKNNIALKTAQ